MPAYFSLVFELNKTETAIKDFYNALFAAGLVFKSGFWIAENESLDEIIEWNQEKLNHDYRLGINERFEHDYKQIELKFRGFSEVRLIVMNVTRASTFTFELIVPEDDFFDTIKQGEVWSFPRKTKRMEKMKRLAKQIWLSTEVLAIQTAWECSNYPPRATHFSRKVKPQIEPFCIIKNTSVVKHCDLPYEEVGRGGVLIEDSDNWNFL